MLLIDWRLWFVACWRLLFVVCCGLLVDRCLQFVVRGVLLVVCVLLFVV